MRSKLLHGLFIIFLSIGLVLVIQGLIDVKEVFNLNQNYFPGNNLVNVGAKNLVTGIYLDIRLYDTIFEASILFVAATGIVFMVKKDEDMLG